MKKLLGIVVLGLLWCNYSSAGDCLWNSRSSECLYKSITGGMTTPTTSDNNTNKIFSLEKKNKELESRIKKLEENSSQNKCSFGKDPLTGKCF